MVEDAELLRRYTEEGSQAAFAELVQRHLALVYFGALRRTVDAQLAADVSQAVFVALAQNARTLRSHPALSGWLFTATRNAAINVRVAEERRRQREQEAFLRQASSSEENQAVEWERLRPLLYDALDVLSDQDRRAVLLRFFGGRSFAEIGRALRLTEEAARKRVERAVDTLHAGLARRGITSTAAAISGALTAEALAQPPAALAATIASAATAGAASGSAAVGAVALLTMAKIKVGVLGAIAATGLVTIGLQFQTARALSAEFRSARHGRQNYVALRKENDSLNRQLASGTAVTGVKELAELRGRILELKTRPPEVDESKLRRVAEFRNAGWATPEAAFETLFWAQVQDIDTLVETFTRSFRFDPDTKRRADAFFAGLNEEARAKFGTSERLFAPFAFGWGASRAAIVEAQKDPIVAVQIIENTNHDNDPDLVNIRWWQRSASGRGFESRLLLTRYGDEWQQGRRNPMSEQVWQKLVSQIDPQTGAARTPAK